MIFLASALLLVSALEQPMQVVESEQDAWIDDTSDETAPPAPVQESEASETEAPPMTEPSPWDFTPDQVDSVARKREAGALVLMPLGGIALTVGASLMIGEVLVKPDLEEEKVWSPKGCRISFGVGGVLAPTGTFMLTAGLLMLMRSRTLSDLAEVMEIMGPSPVWMKWHSAGKGMRITGNVLASVGALLVTGGTLLTWPPSVCDKWACQAYPDGYGAWEGYEHDGSWTYGVIMASTGGVAVVAGIVLMALGYSEQKRFLSERGLTMEQMRTPALSFRMTPGGFVLHW